MSESTQHTSSHTSSHFLIEDFILRELYNKCTRDTDRWTAICENYQEQNWHKSLSVIDWLFQAISNVPSLDFRWCFDQRDCRVRCNDRLQSGIRRKTRMFVISYVLQHRHLSLRATYSNCTWLSNWYFDKLHNSKLYCEKLVQN